MFYKRLIFIPLAILALNASIPYTSEAQELQAKCEAISSIQPKINEIHQFINTSSELSQSDFEMGLSELNDSVNSLYDTAYNCDPYMDSLLEQMLGTIGTIRNSRPS